uniref:Uncharacterized protein n=1 Tax=Arundo donax TaxID=35708 RepID=A0A0A8YYT2_ARUDO
MFGTLDNQVLHSICVTHVMVRIWIDEINCLNYRKSDKYVAYMWPAIFLYFLFLKISFHNVLLDFGYTC